VRSEDGIPSSRESKVETFHTSPNPLPPSVNFVRPTGQIPRRLMVRTSHNVGMRTTGFPSTVEVVSWERR